MLVNVLASSDFGSHAACSPLIGIASWWFALEVDVFAVQQSSYNADLDILDATLRSHL